jgi:NADPH:quinone reductase-like Zn-dependent oxidoreductase
LSNRSEDRAHPRAADLYCDESSAVPADLRADLADRRGYDLILDLAAYRPASAYRRSLMPGGRYLYVGGSVATLLQVLTIGPVIGRAARKRIRLLAVRLGVQHLDPLVELIRAGKITTVIDRRFPLSEVPEALRYLGEGHAKGKVVVTVG